MIAILVSDIKLEELRIKMENDAGGRLKYCQLPCLLSSRKNDMS